MTQSTLVWLLTGALSLVLTVLGFTARLITTQVLKKLDSIIAELQNLTRVTTLQEGDIKNLKDAHTMVVYQLNEHSQELSGHSQRILKLEITQEKED